LPKCSDSHSRSNSCSDLKGRTMHQKSHSGPIGR
jgi:hypothetical protein